jgi:hypothetical protein
MRSCRVAWGIDALLVINVVIGHCHVRRLPGVWCLSVMMTKISYAGYRFPPVIIQQAIWLYARFTLSFRDVEDLLAERGITVSYETVRRWVNHFGPRIAGDLHKRRPKPPSVPYVDGPDWQAFFSRRFERVGGLRSYVRPVCAETMSAGPDEVRLRRS